MTSSVDKVNRKYVIFIYLFVPVCHPVCFILSLFSMTLHCHRSDTQSVETRRMCCETFIRVFIEARATVAVMYSIQLSE